MKSLSVIILSGIIAVTTSAPGQKKYTGPPMFLNVNAIKLDMKKINGEGQFTTQYSWMLTDGNVKSEIFQYPQDEWHSRLLYQIFNPIAPDDSGFIDNFGNRKIIPTPFVSNGINDFSQEIRRYRPPYVTVDGIAQQQEYTWQVDPDLKPDMKAVWEDIIPYWGIRTHIELIGFSNHNHENYLIWKASYKFTGETRRPIESPDSSRFFPDQTIRLWWPLSFSFGPSKAGEYFAMGGFAYEGVDDLDSWFAGKSVLNQGELRDSMKVAYYWDYKRPGIRVYQNGSTDDIGDPERSTGHLISTQIPGFTLLHCAKNSFNPDDDDQSQPYSMPHAEISGDLWGRRDFGLRDTYIGHDNRGKFPLDPITEGWLSSNQSQYGPMRFITVGPYELTKNSQAASYDSICAVYAIGVGSISRAVADTVGRAWLKGEISDSEKDSVLLSGRDSLFHALDRAKWAWQRSFDIPDPPPPPDVEITSDADRVIVEWSYPDPDYYLDPDTKVDDWYAWRIYRKIGAAYVNDPSGIQSSNYWEMIYETTGRNELSYIDTDVIRGVSYYYAVTAVDDGSQNTDGLNPGEMLESSRYVNRSAIAAIPFKEGLAESDRALVVPNPASTAAGIFGYPDKPNQISFVNLPYWCLLTIYTETGDFINSIDHAGTDQEIWEQKTKNNQFVSSGIYILAVTESESFSGKSLPDHFVKFVLVR
ncbi:MAG: hypothetical protein H8D42_02490 [Candidatus Marinimicrobia bacterium]|nr:hypothetical protein [Candidatus Neomarinimicrobiota bacterium]